MTNDTMVTVQGWLGNEPQLREVAPWMRVITVTAANDVSTAISAMRAGTADYMTKPCQPEELVHAVGQQLATRRLEQRVESLEQERENGNGKELESTASPAVRLALDVAHRVADTDATLLILGENGTGKTALARAIHRWSRRRDAVFATVSCPSLTAELLASELFGHVRGAFTGAADNRQGRVQVAEGGTLFLDEVGDLPLSLQPKLLRFLQDHEYERVGDPHTRTADVRVIAATNRDLTAMVAEGKFREDLLYRLNVVTLTVPPLRERNEDIRTLAQGLLEKFVRQYEKPARRFSDAAANMLASYEWPGNLRELRNVADRSVLGIEHGFPPFGTPARRIAAQPARPSACGTLTPYTAQSSTSGADRSAASTSVVATFSREDIFDVFEMRILLEADDAAARTRVERRLRIKEERAAAERVRIERLRLLGVPRRQAQRICAMPLPDIDAACQADSTGRLSPLNPTSPCTARQAAGRSPCRATTRMSRRAPGQRAGAISTSSTWSTFRTFRPRQSWAASR